MKKIATNKAESNFSPVLLAVMQAIATQNEARKPSVRSLTFPLPVLFAAPRDELQTQSHDTNC